MNMLTNPSAQMVRGMPVDLLCATSILGNFSVSISELIIHAALCRIIGFLAEDILKKGSRSSVKVDGGFEGSLKGLRFEV